MAGSILDAFQKLDAPTKHALAEITSPLLLSLAALDIAARLAGVQRLTAEHIVACLEAAGVAVKRKSVSRALARAGNKVATSADPSGDVGYRLMTRGRREVEPHLKNNALSVVRVEGGSHHTARQHLAELLAGLSGTARICDPYFGLRSLETIDHIPAKTGIRFLTAKTNESALKTRGAFHDFAKQRKNTEFRVLPPPHDLHDRYVLADEALLLVGHGLKDIGGKESFVIRVEQNFAPDLLDALRVSFDAKWAAGVAL